MSGHRLGVFQGATIVEIGGYARGAEGVIADRPCFGTGGDGQRGVAGTYYFKLTLLT